MSQTDNLSLPFILPSQAQKHVTHNESLLALDAIVQLSVESRNVDTPPSSSADGARFLISSSPSGDFANHAEKIAAFQDGVFNFLAPQTGWLCFVADEGIWFYFDGGNWLELITSDAEFDQLGISTSADPTNRLSLSSPASLFNNSGSDHRIKINKASISDTASIIFQTSFSGRAEFGLSGDDQFRIKVSSDGNSFTEALAINETVIDAKIPLKLPNYIMAALPSPSDAGQIIYVSDASGGAIPAFSDGSNWRRTDTRVIVS